MKIEELHQLPDFEKIFDTITTDLVIVEPDEESPEAKDSPIEPWRLFNVYIINKEPFWGYNIGVFDSLELKGKIYCDIKTNNLIYYWNPNGKIQISGIGIITIESI
jgi:hypothetical protein